MKGGRGYWIVNYAGPNVNVVWVSCTWTEQSTCQLKARLLVLHLIPVVQYITDNQPFDCTIFVWRS